MGNIFYFLNHVLGPQPTNSHSWFLRYISRSWLLACSYAGLDFSLPIWTVKGFDVDQIDANLLYFTIRPLQSSTCFVLIIRRLNCIDAASGIVLLRENSVPSQPVHRTGTDWEDDTRYCINTIQPPDDEHVMLETYRKF